MSFGLDASEVLSRALKYLIQGLSVCLAAFYIPKGGKMKLEDVVMIGVTAAAVFATLDLLSPSIGASARTGAGFGIGANLVGFPH